MSADISWFFLLCGGGTAAGCYYMHFARHQAQIESSKYTTGTWIGYGHFAAVLGVLGLLGVIFALIT